MARPFIKLQANAGLGWVAVGLTRRWCYREPTAALVLELQTKVHSIRLVTEKAPTRALTPQKIDVKLGSDVGRD